MSFTDFPVATFGLDAFSLDSATAGDLIRRNLAALHDAGGPFAPASRIKNDETDGLTTDAADFDDDDSILWRSGLTMQTSRLGQILRGFRLDIYAYTDAGTATLQLTAAPAMFIPPAVPVVPALYVQTTTGQVTTTPAWFTLDIPLAETSTSPSSFGTGLADRVSIAYRRFCCTLKGIIETGAGPIRIDWVTASAVNL